MRGPTLTPHVEPQDEPVLRAGFDGRPYAAFIVNIVPPHDGGAGDELYYWQNPDDPARAMNYDASFVEQFNPDEVHVYVAAERVRLVADGPDKWPPVEAVMPWPLYVPGTMLQRFKDGQR